MCVCVDVVTNVAVALYDVVDACCGVYVAVDEYDYGHGYVDIDVTYGGY